MKTTDDMNELFVVVDRVDDVVGYKTRKECHSDKSLTHRTTSVVIYNKQGKILLQKRSMTKDIFSGYYATSASGHVSKGTSYEESAKREMCEEIGIDTPLTFKTKFYIEESWESEFVAIFTGTHEGPFNIYKEEVDSVMFYTPEEIQKIRNNLTSTAAKTLKILGLLT